MLPCVNCQTPVDSAQAKIFASVFVCPQCYALAERFMQRATEELKALLLVQQEAIRLALTERRFFLGAAQPSRELSKKEVLEQILQFTEKADARRNRTVSSHPAQQSFDFGDNR